MPRNGGDRSPVHTAASTPVRASSRRIVASAALGAGVVLIACGEYIIAYNEVAANGIVYALGGVGRSITAAVAEMFPRGIALGLSLFFAGAVLIARAIGAPSTPELGGDLPHPLVFGLRHRVLMVTAMLLAGTSAVFLAGADPGRGTLVVWIAALAAAGASTCTLDRARGTRFGNPFTRSEWVSVTVLLILEVALVAHDITDWHWAGIPDESFFFGTAKAIVEGRLRAFPLSEQGVFGYHPMLSSYYQALFMRLFGTGIFAWRLSSVTALAVSVPFVYLLTRELWGRRAGSYAAVLFGTAQLAVGFAHLGYNNAQVYPVILGSLGTLIWSLRRRSLAGYFLAGCIAGFGFYTYYPARLAPLLLVLLWWSAGRWRQGRGEASALFGGILIATLPVLVHPAASLTRMFQQTSFRPEPAASWPWSVVSNVALGKVLRHWLLSVVYSAWSRCGWNFEWLPVVDPVVAALAAVGLCLSVATLRRRTAARFLLPAYLISALVVGALSQYDCPPLTRLLTLAPFTAMLAAMALDRLLDCATAVLRPRAVAVLGMAVVCAAVLWNVAALHRNMYVRHHGYGNGTTGELIRVTGQLPRHGHLIYIQNEDNDSYNVDQILEEYGLREISTYIRPYGPRVAETLANVTPPFAVVYDLRRDEEKREVEAALARRFPAARWSDSAPGERWNLRYTVVAGD